MTKLIERQVAVGRNANGTPRLRLATLDDCADVLGIRLDREEIAGLRGAGWHELRDETGNLTDLGVFKNLITDTGDLYYGAGASASSGAPSQVTGMRLGTGTAASAKATNTGTPVYARIQTYTTGVTSSVAIYSGFPTATDTAGAGCTVVWQSLWTAGQATLNGLSEVTLSNAATIGTETGSYNVDANTIARALLSPVVNKAALDTLTVTWNHVLLGA